MQVGHHASALIYISSPVYITNDHFPVYVCCVSMGISEFWEEGKTGKKFTTIFGIFVLNRQLEQIFLFICQLWVLNGRKHSSHLWCLSVSVTYVLCWPSGILPNPSVRSELPKYCNSKAGKNAKNVEEFVPLLWIKWGIMSKFHNYFWQ